MSYEDQEDDKPTKSAIEFLDAHRENTNMLIGVAGPSGAGKTKSALLLARGLVGGIQNDHLIGVADTEGGRAKHHAPRPGEKPSELLFGFRHFDFKPPYTPQRFRDVAIAMENAGLKVGIFDSASDEYEGEGGIVDMHDQALLRMSRKKTYDEIEEWQFNKLNAPAWNEPKTLHKKLLMAKLRVMRIHLIFAMRAEDKVKFVKIKTDDGREKTAIEAAGWVPICEKRFMYDMTLSFAFGPENPGVPLMKDGKAMYGKIPDELLHAFPPGQRVTEQTGRLLASWAAGDEPPILGEARIEARKGTEHIRGWLTERTKAERVTLQPFYDELKRIAEGAAQPNPEAAHIPHAEASEPRAAQSGAAVEGGEATPGEAPATADEYMIYARHKIATEQDPRAWYDSDKEMTFRGFLGLEPAQTAELQGLIRQRGAK